VKKTFAGHKNITNIISPYKLKRVKINGKDKSESFSIKEINGHYETEVQFSHLLIEEELSIIFE
jgi:hypothetical protein